MFLLRKALEFWFKQCIIQQLLDWHMFPFFTQEWNKLEKASFPSPELLSYERCKSKPLWNREHLFSVMKKLVGSYSGVLAYQDLCKEMGRPVVDSLIEHNIIHLRPTKLCSYDVDVGDIKGGLITAESPCGLHVMKHLVNNEAKLAHK